MTQQTEKNKAEALVEVRCQNILYDSLLGRYYTCNRLLGMLPANSPYRIKCPRCKMMNIKEK